MIKLTESGFRASGDRQNRESSNDRIYIHIYDVYILSCIDVGQRMLDVKMLLKRFSYFCSFIGLLLLLTACSSGGSSDNNNSSNSEQEQDQANSVNTSNISRFYINQSIPAQDSDQSASEKAPLVAGKQGLLRVFVTPSGNSAQEPVLRLHYRRADNSTGYTDIAPPAGGLSNQVDESTLTENYNYTMDASLMQPGLQIYFELDPDNLIAEIDESNKRYPANGYLSLDIKTVPTLDVVVVPIQVNNNGIPNITLSSARAKLALAQKLFPLQKINISIRSPAVSYNGNDWVEMLNKLADTRRSEVPNGSKTLYVGLIDHSPDGSNTAGIGYMPGFTSVSKQNTHYSLETIAHELGHNFNLKHAPCGDPAGPDANYPYSGGIIGISGYDIISKLLKSSSSNDLMGYCPQPIWISDYNYKIVYKFRQPPASLRSLHQVQTYQAPGKPEPVLMVSGSIINEQVEFKRVFQLQAWPDKAIHNGHYQLHIYGENNHLLHEQSFKPRIIDHSQAMHFNVMVPTTAFNNEAIQRLAVYQGDTLLTERRAKPKIAARTATRYQVVTEQAASPLSWQGEQLRIQWDNQTYQSVMLRDAEQKTTLAIDSSGKILLQASSLKNQKQLILIYSDGLNSHSETLSIPPR